MFQTAGDRQSVEHQDFEICIQMEIRFENDKGEMERIIRLFLVLRGFMDLEAFDVEAFPGTARRPSQR
eukprot:3110605-Pyramimonas_sp.AAC.1